KWSSHNILPSARRRKASAATPRLGGLMKLAQELGALFDRDLTRLEQELRAFPDTETLWMVAPGVSSAAGTLALHLEGNLREYIGRQLGHHEYTRDRACEFSARGVPQQE